MMQADEAILLWQATAPHDPAEEISVQLKEDAKNAVNHVYK